MNSIILPEYRLPVITIDFYKSMTGEDLAILEGSKEQAQEKIKGMSMKAKRYLYQKKTRQAQLVFDYLICTNRWYREAFELYVVAFIESTMFSDVDFVFGKDAPPNSVLSAINGSVLSNERFDYITVEKARAYANVY